VPSIVVATSHQLPCSPVANTRVFVPAPAATQLRMELLMRHILLSAMLLVLAYPVGAKVHATVAYNIRGPRTVLGPGGEPDVLRVGSQILMDHAMTEQG
jgi:hypothetical protein